MSLETCEVCGETSHGGRLHNPRFHRLEERLARLEACCVTVPTEAPPEVVPAHKFAALAEELKAEMTRREEAEAKLRLVATSTENVWRWQGDGGDAPASLSCPVVMSADTLRSLLPPDQSAVDARRRAVLRELRSYLMFERSRFGHIFTDATDPLPTMEDEVDAFIERRISLWRSTWVLPLLDELDGGERATLFKDPYADDPAELVGVQRLRAKMRAEEREAAVGELKRRADWLNEECHKGGTCYVEREEAYIAVQALERFYAGHPL